MFTAARVRDPETQKAGTPMPTSHNFIHNSGIEDSPTHRLAQYPVLVPRIIATHWLRPEPMEAANG